MKSYPTPHIDAKPGDFAKTVLMPGDPLRAKFISENFLEKPVLVNNVRGVQGYTGEYKNKKISVMASGMGMPSISIYSHELFNIFEVDNIIRIGSAGAMQDNINVRDIVIALSASTNSSMVERYGVPGHIAPTADFGLVEKCVQKAKEAGLNFHVGNILSSDTFYNFESYLPDDMKSARRWADMGVMAVEMEAAALYLNAQKAGKKAVAICTISDHLNRHDELTAKEREQSLTDMITLALETAADLEK
ncbi:MAG: purine-nucleoside phosphorylase [Clostridia bacterium]|nr:purine-nucleoside phosphorylase [Clostridia bacterium]